MLSGFEEEKQEIAADTRLGKQEVLVKFPVIAVIGVAIVLQTGCVVGRRSFELPVQSHDIPAATQGKVYIAAVTDDREFQNKPSDPSVPSIDGDVTKLSAQAKDQMIGRQRNTWGKAMGDIALPAGDSVTRRMRLLVEQGLMRKGYEISADPAAARSLTVSITEFWAWTTPGLWTLTFEAKLSCSIVETDASGRHTAVVKGYGMNHGQVAKDANWQEAYDPAFEDFIANFGTQWGNLTSWNGRRFDGGEAASGTAPGLVALSPLALEAKQ